jgi:type II secretory pathway pseudopilin PulG
MNVSFTTRLRNRNLQGQRGTTLFELVVSMAVFLVISGAAFSLFNQQQLATTNLQGSVGLNLALRNTTSQLQLDLANAGNGYYQQGALIPSWPVGVTIVNNFVQSGQPCYTTAGGYTSTCFDQLNIISNDPVLYPAINATDSTGGTASTNCSYTNTGNDNVSGSTGSPNTATTVYAQPATGLTAAQTAAKFVAGDQLLFVQGAGQYMTTARLVSAGSSSGNVVALSIYQTYVDGTNIYPSSTSTLYGDPLDITACDRTDTGSITGYQLVTPTSGPNVNLTTPNCPPYLSTNLTNATANKIALGVSYGIKYCSGDWIIKLSPIKYYAKQNSDPNNPWQLIRWQNGIESVVMDQLLGFKIGANTWDSQSDQSMGGYSSPYYNYQASTYCIGGNGVDCTGTGGIAQGYNFALIRSVRLSILARTAPNYSQTYKFTNTFDGGPYQVQGTAIVINPRNLSMSDDQALP